MTALVAALLITGCLTSSDAPEKPAVQQPHRGKAPAKGKAPKKGDPSKVPPTARKPPKPIGTAGAMTGNLVLTAKGEGEKMRTKAELALTWSGGSHTAMLGMTPGACTQTEPEAMGEEQPLWWANCGNSEKSAAFAVLQADEGIVVKRSVKGDDGALGEFKTVRTIPLVDGATLQRDE